VLFVQLSDSRSAAAPWGGTTSTTGQSDAPSPSSRTPTEPSPTEPSPTSAKAIDGQTTDGQTTDGQTTDGQATDGEQAIASAPVVPAQRGPGPAESTPAAAGTDTPPDTIPDGAAIPDGGAQAPPVDDAEPGSAEPGPGSADEPGSADGSEGEAGSEGADEAGSADGSEGEAGAEDEEPEFEEPGSGAGSVAADGLVAAPVARRRAPLWAKGLLALGTVLVLLSAGTVVALHVLVNRYDKSVSRAELIDPGARVSPTADGGGVLDVPFVPQGVSGPLNFLLIGSDARDNNPGMGERSDTIILVHIPATLDKAYLISVPRDLRVRIPADPTTGYKGGRGKINGAFNFGGGGTGGFQLLSKTLNQLMGIKFDGAAIINFDGFQNAVHLLGGVNMCVDQVTKSIHTGTVYQIGCQHLGAVQALDYVRQRELLPEGDYDRQRHQQQFLKAILQEAIDQGVATNPIKLDELIRALGSALTVDTNGVPLSNLVFGLKDIPPSSLVGIKVPSHPQTISGISYVIQDDEATSLYQAIASDTLDDWVAANKTWVNSI
jgi:LCP family protein required for cell wall assembly